MCVCLPFGRKIARCFRDEDLRADRQPEFTQLDIEMSFMTQQGIMDMVEQMIREVFRACSDANITLSGASFQRMTYAEAMSLYGTDKPDLRYDMRFHDVTSIVRDCGFQVFSSSEMVKGLCVCDGTRISNSRLKPKGDVCREAQAAGAAGLVSVRVEEDGGIMGAKAVNEGLSHEQKSRIVSQMNAKPVGPAMQCHTAYLLIHSVVCGSLHRCHFVLI